MKDIKGLDMASKGQRTTKKAQYRTAHYRTIAFVRAYRTSRVHYRTIQKKMLKNATEYLKTAAQVTRQHSISRFRSGARCPEDWTLKITEPKNMTGHRITAFDL